MAGIDPTSANALFIFFRRQRNLLSEIFMAAVAASFEWR